MFGAFLNDTRHIKVSALPSTKLVNSKIKNKKERYFDISLLNIIYVIYCLCYSGLFAVLGKWNW